METAAHLTDDVFPRLPVRQWVLSVPRRLRLFSAESFEAEEMLGYQHGGFSVHYLWAVLNARIYKVFPLQCPYCGGQMRLIAFITHSTDIQHMNG